MPAEGAVASGQLKCVVGNSSIAAAAWSPAWRLIGGYNGRPCLAAGLTGTPGCLWERPRYDAIALTRKQTCKRAIDATASY